jgi:hypothetical protein
MNTKKKPNPLMAGLEQFDRKAAPPSELAGPRARADKPLSRQGAVQIAAFFPEEVRTQLKIIAAEQRRDIQDVLAEGLNLIFAKYGKAEIAPRKP